MGIRQPVSSSDSPAKPSNFAPRTNVAVQAPADAGGDSDASKLQATVSRELADFLIELSIAMQKHAIYPAGHPLLNDAVDGVMKKLALLLVDRPALNLGIARRQLIIEGVATDPNHPLLRELSGRLHKHHLGAVKFNQGVSREELEDALATVAVDPGRTNEPLGDKADELSARWANVRLFPLNYDRLELLNEGRETQGEDAPVKRGPSSKAAQLWAGMARAALMLDESVDVEGETINPRVLADAIDKKQQEKAYDQVVVGYLQQIADELKNAGGTPETLEIQQRVSDLVRQLSPATLKKLLQMGGDASQRRQFLLNASQGMTVEAVLELVQAASQDGRQTISHSMMRLFSKLSKYAESDSDPTRRANAEASVREHMTKLISEWNLDDPNPTAYGQVLHRMAQSKRVQGASPYIDCEPERILQMGFEIGVMGPRFETALDAVLNSAHLEVVLNLLDKAPDAEFAESVWSYLDSHDILWAALSEARIDFALLERLVRRKRLSAVDPVLDTAEKVKDSRTRERLLDMLTELGDDIGPYLARRIEGARPDLRRDFFLMLGKLTNIPADFDASRFLLHSDAAVRREAVRLLLKFVETREQAIAVGLADTDERATFYALTAAHEGGCPPRAVNLVRQRIEKGGLDSSLMTLAIRVLAAADSGVTPMLSGRGRTSMMLRSSDAQAASAIVSKKTFDWLLGKVASKSIFGKWKLQHKSAEMLAALGALSAYWNYDPDVQEIVSLATKSNDPELRKALSAGRVTGKFKAITE